MADITTLVITMTFLYTCFISVLPSLLIEEGRFSFLENFMALKTVIYILGAKLCKLASFILFSLQHFEDMLPTISLTPILSTDRAGAVAIYGQEIELKLSLRQRSFA